MADARRVLTAHFGYPDFRPAQRPVVSAVLAGDDVLAVLPTGAGKSACFQVPAMLGDGLTLVISPLVALMQDQVGAARRRRMPAAALHSGLDARERRAVEAELQADGLRLLYAAPERLDQLAELLTAAGRAPQLLAVDEAHCIAEWGHDFRPSYRRIGALRHQLGRPQCVALTGSATPAVRDDIADQLRLGRCRPGAGSFRHVASFDRPNLTLRVRAIADERDRIGALATALAASRGDGVAIVYVPTRGLAESVASAVVRRGSRAVPYHAGLDPDTRRRALERFLGGDARVVVATSAFGMGIDKPDVRLVAHWTLPPTPEAYYQEAGRAGRDGAPATCLLLHRAGDAELHRRQLDVTFPPRVLAEAVWADPRRGAQVASNTLASIARLRRELEPERGPVDWSRVLRRRHAALERIDAMARYATGLGCRRSTLLAWFGEPAPRCGRCDRCEASLFDRVRHWLRR